MATVLPFSKPSSASIPNTQRKTLRCVSTSISRRVRGRSSNDPVSPESPQNLETTAVPASRLSATQFRAPNRCPRNIQPATHESKLPGPIPDVPPSHKNSGRHFQRTHQSPACPVTGSDVHRMDGPQELPAKPLRSTLAPASRLLHACPTT